MLPACILSYRQLYSTVALLIGITIESEDTCSDFSPESQNLLSLVSLSLVIEGTPSGKILLTCHDLLPQSKMRTSKTFFFFTLSMIITIMISLFKTQVPTNQLVSIGL